MKKLLLYSSILIHYILFVSAQEGDNSFDDQTFWVIEEQNFPHSFMFTRPIQRNIAAQQQLWHDIIFNTYSCTNAGIQILPIYQQSMSSDRVKKYFLFNHKTTLSVKGDDVIFGNSNLRDIRAEWIGLPSDFSGKFTINPKQRQFAVWTEAKFDLKNLTCYSFLDNWWIGIALPFQMVENNINITQSNIENPGTPPGPTNIIEALNQPDWLYGKFDGKQSKNGPAELILKVGSRFLDHDGFQLGLYSGLLIPWRGPQHAEFVFNPFLGNDRHFGFVGGGSLQLPLFCDNDCQLFAFTLAIENIYLFRHTEHRTLDLRFKPWSRYLLLNKNDGTLNIPGVNVLTRKVHVRPYNQVDLAASLRAQYIGFEAELGYDLWAHPREKILLRKPFPKNTYGIAGVGFVPGTNIGATASTSDIAFQGPNDQDDVGNNIFVALEETDLNLDSGGSKSAITHGVHATFGYMISEPGYDLFIGIGGFAEFSQHNSALDNWGVWGKVGGAI